MNRLRRFFLGKPLNPLDKNARGSIALIAFFAWVGLGADGLSSICYGPEQAFYELIHEPHLALYLAVVTALTVCLIAAAYNQVIKLFPNGGGGYKVATQLLGKHAGLVSGVALLIDYTLTISISVASGIDAAFSMLPAHWQHFKLVSGVVVLFVFLMLNLRGAKESIKFLLPIFLGFFITHVAIIIAGIVMHDRMIPQMLHDTVTETKHAVHSFGWWAVLAVFLRAYSIGGGTYTGLEAVSNNVNMLAEPRVRTGTWTMFYMATSLSLVAGGIIILYLLWHVQPVAGKTLNAVAFTNILSGWHYGHAAVLVLMIFEAGLLFVASNTGFLGGPAVLANMSMDSWVPRRFGMLSSRLVTQNGIVFFGVAALAVLLATGGSVSILVVLYSMNVFLTFTISLAGLSTYYWQHRKKLDKWFWQLMMCMTACFICAGIFTTIMLEKFELGGWVTILITSSTVALGLVIRRHYQNFNQLKIKLNRELHLPLVGEAKEIPRLDHRQPTAVFLVKDIGAALHSILWVQRMFPNHFKNFIFMSHGEVDIGSFGSDVALQKLKVQTDGVLDYLIKYSQAHGIAAESRVSYGTDPISHLFALTEELNQTFHNAVYFASRYVYPTETWFTRILHSDLPGIIQRRVQGLGVKMLILPLNLKI